MVLVTICALLFCGLSLSLLVAQRRRNLPVPSPYATPPPGWPDIPIDALTLFDRKGRINAPMPARQTPRLRRFQTFRDTQAFVASLIDTRLRHPPKITLQLSDTDGPDWTDVILDGHVVAHVQTMALTEAANSSAA